MLKKKQCQNNSSLSSSALIPVHTVIASLLFVLPAYADEDKKSFSLKPAITAQVGSDATEIKLGMGGWQTPTDHVQFFISHFKSEDDYSISGLSGTNTLKLSKQEYTSSRIGIDVDMFGSKAAGQGSFYLYKNDSQFNIDRYGFGLKFILGKMLTDKARIQAGIDIMPEFLSTDWDAKALFEYEVNAGATYRVTSKIDATINYRHGATFDDIRVTHYSQVMAGISLKL